MIDFIARVVDVRDPDKAGKLKIRVFGIHDDESRITDDLLPWAVSVFPITSGLKAGVAGSTTGAVVGSVVIGFWADDQKQIPMVVGTLGSSAKTSSDFPLPNSGSDLNAVVNNNIIAVATANCVNISAKTIGSILPTSKIADNLQQIGSKYLSDVLSPIKGATSKLSDLKSAISSATNIDQVTSVLNSYASSANSVISEAVSSLPTGAVVQSVQNAVASSTSYFNTAEHVISSAGSDLTSSVKDALKRATGLKVVMGSVYPSIESAFDVLKEANGR